MLNLDVREQDFWMKEAMRLKFFRKLDRFKASLLPHLKKDDIRIEFKRLDIEIKKLDREE